MLVHNGYFAEVKKRARSPELKDSTQNSVQAMRKSRVAHAATRNGCWNDASRCAFTVQSLRFERGLGNNAQRVPIDFAPCASLATDRRPRRQTLGRGLRLAVDANGEPGS